MASQLKIPEFKPETERPKFIKYDLPQLQSTAARYAANTYNRSDAFRAKTRPEWDRALKVGEQNILKDTTGDTALLPMIQAESVRAGLGSALGSLGDASVTEALAPDSAVTSRVAANLYGSGNALNQQVRENRYRALTVGSQLFPERQIGLSGIDAATIMGANTLGKNSWNDANYHDKAENERLNWRVQTENIRSQIQQQNSNAQADATSKAGTSSALIQGGAAVAGVAVLAIAL